MRLADLSSKLSRRHYLPIALLTLLAAAIIGSSFQLIGELLDANHWVSQILVIQEQTQVALISMLNCETAMRGYLSTGDPNFLEPYNNSRNIVFVHLSTLKDLTANNPKQQAMMPALFRLADEQMVFCRSVIAWRQHHPNLPVSDTVSLRPGKKLMDEYRVVTAKVLNRSHELLELKRQSVRTAWANVYTAVMLMAACMIGALGWIVSISRETARLAEQERLRSSLLSCVSHDLRTPLAAITGATTSLMSSFESLSPETAKELLQSIYDEADRMNRLVGNLLEMTRLASGTITINKEWLPIEEVTGAAISRLETRLRNHHVVVRLPEDLPLVQADELLLQQLFINLLDNAVKYSAPENEIKVSAIRNASSVQVEVFNEGPGLAPGEENKIFEKFYRGDNVGTAGGAGLGLAICRAIVEAHGGKIWVENRQGKGVAFVFSLPLSGEAPRIKLDDVEAQNGGDPAATCDSQPTAR